MSGKNLVERKNFFHVRDTRLRTYKLCVVVGRFRVYIEMQVNGQKRARGKQQHREKELPMENRAALRLGGGRVCARVRAHMYDGWIVFAAAVPPQKRTRRYNSRYICTVRRWPPPPSIA